MVTSVVDTLVTVILPKHLQNYRPDPLVHRTINQTPPLIAAAQTPPRYTYPLEL